MSEYVDSALFVYSPECEHLLKILERNTFGVHIKPARFTDFIANPELYLDRIEHVVVSGTLTAIKSVIRLAMEHGFSVGLIPAKKQKSLRECYGLPVKADRAVDVALRNDAIHMDIIRCNQEILLFKATVGRLPLLDSTKTNYSLKTIWRALKRFVGIRLLGFEFTINNKKIDTAACGCMIVQQHERSFASRLIEHDSSATDGMVSLVIAAPRSIIDYLRFLYQSAKGSFSLKRITSTIGYIKSREIEITSERQLDVYVDGECLTRTPLTCETIPLAVRLNVGERLRQKQGGDTAPKESLNILNLPTGKELLKAKKKRLSFFSYASEERFRDLFVALRDDAKTDYTYVLLMLLSTLLATIGLYLNSASVIIGAMLLAPLMAPIVSLAMGLLRRDEWLSLESMKKAVVGVIIALMAASLISLLFPHKPVTSEMEARLNPTLLDLGVAIVAGIAGAYTKSFKEILQSLAGVAIAVALVPPLAVAGIGLGRLDFYFFAEAFLLFSTNFIGITLAAALTFRALGYSAAVKNMRGMVLIMVMLVLISFPLFFSYKSIVEKVVFEKAWQQERFLVNDKYLIIKKAKLAHRRDREVIYVDILARDQLTRNDLAEFKRKIQRNFSNKLIVRANITYIP